MSKARTEYPAVQYSNELNQFHYCQTMKYKGFSSTFREREKGREGQDGELSNDNRGRVESAHIHSQGGSLPFTSTLCCYLPLTTSLNEAGRAYVKRHCFYRLCMFHYPTSRRLCPDRQFGPIQVIQLWMASVCGGKWPVPWFSWSCGYCSRCFTVFSVCVPIML